jgi:hypothetical protein
MHPQDAINIFGGRTGYRMVRTGNAYVQITTRRSSLPDGSSGVEKLTKWYDPERYKPINFTEDGLNWDIILQTGRLIRSGAQGHPLSGYNIDKVYLVGWSGAGALTQFILNEFHNLARLPSGAPIFDGYLPGEPSRYPAIHRGATTLPSSDLRTQRVIPTDVPTIQLFTRHTATTPPESDDPKGRYRKFEVAGLVHSATVLSDFPSGYQVVKSGFPVTGSQFCPQPNRDIEQGDYIALALHYLDQWSRQNTPPPRAEPLTGDKDEYGNGVGGVRSPYVEVPIASYHNISTPECGNRARIPFSPELIKKLYPTKEGYMSKFVASTDELLRQGFLLPEDAKRIIEEASQLDWASVSGSSK